MRRQAAALLALAGLLMRSAVVVEAASSRKNGGPGKPPPPAVSKVPEGAVLDVGCGFLLISNRGAINFTMLLKSPTAKQLPIENGSLFVIDDVLVQVTMTNAAEIGMPKARGLALLKAHMQWEASFAARARGWQKIAPSGDPIDVGIGNIPTMMWGYDAPTPFEIMNQRINRMMYVTAALDDVVFVLGIPMRETDDAGAVARAIKRSLITLRRQKGPTDPTAIARELESKPGQWRGCLDAP